MNGKDSGLALSFYRRVYTRIFPDYIRELCKLAAGCGSVLDLGCGENSPVRFLKNIRSEGVDAFSESVEKSKSRGIHEKYHVMDVLTVDKKFADGSFDCVVALDLIEHLSKSDGLALLEKMERIAKRRVAVFTPNGFMPQDAYHGNEWQVHKSGWTADEMKSLGYHVIGVNGLKTLRQGEFLRLKYRPKLFWWVVSDLTQLFVRGRPEMATQILCVKEKVPC